MLNVESEVHNIAIGNNIRFAFNTQLAVFFAGSFRSKLHKVIVLDYLGADKAFFKVGMDNTCSLRSCKALRNGPCANFLYTGGKVGGKV
jgi:hypothetical protein